MSRQCGFGEGLVGALYLFGVNKVVISHNVERMFNRIIPCHIRLGIGGTKFLAMSKSSVVAQVVVYI